MGSGLLERLQRRARHRAGWVHDHVDALDGEYLPVCSCGALIPGRHRTAAGAVRAARDHCR